MNFLTRLWNRITGASSTSTADESTPANSKTKTTSIMPSPKTKPKKGEISIMPDISDEEINHNMQRTKYIQETKNHNHKVAKGETLEKIAKKYNVTINSIIEINQLDTKNTIRTGQVLKIPPTKKVKNVKNLNDVANIMSVSSSYTMQIKRLEATRGLPDNKFQNTPYKDVGVESIGIGHVIKPGEKRKLTDAEVCTVFAEDLLAAEDELIGVLGRQNYQKLPTPIKEALLDMVFNKGISIITKSEGLVYCLKAGKYEAAINKMTYNKVNTAKPGENPERSGLSKRRLFDISLATKIYTLKIPQSNINTAQQVYNRGVALLRAECKQKGLKFENQIVGYNKDIQGFLGNRIKLKYITK